MIKRLVRPPKAIAYQAVLQAEIEHLKRNVDEPRNKLYRGFIWIMVLIALIAFAWRVINTIPQEPSLIYWLLKELKLDKFNYFSMAGINDPLTIFPLLFPLGVVVWELWLMLRTLVISANSIVRERDAKRWELLLLTGLDTRQIIAAKWRAVVHDQWKNYALLAIMRIGAISILAMSFSVEFTFGQFPWFGYGSDARDDTVFLVAVSIVLVSAVFIIVLTMLNLLITAACGIIGGSITQRVSLALPFSVAVRLSLIIVVVILAGVPGYLGLKPDIETFNYYPDPVFSTTSLILSLIGTTAIDNGGIAAGLLMRFGYDFRWRDSFSGFVFFLDRLRGHGPAFFTALLLSIGIGIAFTYSLVWLSGKIAARQSIEVKL